MLDTNIFNRLADGRINLKSLEGKKLVATHVQLDELNSTVGVERRTALTDEFDEIVEEQVPTESAVWDVSSFDQSKFCGDDTKYNEMLARLTQLDNKSKKKPGDAATNRARDILIAETAIVGRHTLLTADRNLHQVCTEFGGVSELLD